MNKDQRKILRKLWILRYAEEIGHVAKALRRPCTFCRSWEVERPCGELVSLP